MKWRDFDILVATLRKYVPCHVPECEDRIVMERLIQRELERYRQNQRQAEINRGQRDAKTGRMLPQKPKR